MVQYTPRGRLEITELILFSMRNERLYNATLSKAQAIIMSSSELLSHNHGDVDLDSILGAVRSRIEKSSTDAQTKQKNLQILEELCEFELGIYLLKNNGVNGYWTNYILSHPSEGRRTGLNNLGKPHTALEKKILDDLPIMRATQERFGIFLRKNQECVKDGASLACIPSGLLGELLNLDYSGVEQISLYGIDLDPGSLNEAKKMASANGIDKFVTLLQSDAWEISLDNKFDLISSNGLNIYEPDPSRVRLLYRKFFDSLAPGGKLVTSFVTPPPNVTDNCEWDFKHINQDDLMFQKTLFTEVLQPNWQCYCSSEEMKDILSEVGFSNITFEYDKGRIFPTVIAEKPR